MNRQRLAERLVEIASGMTEADVVAPKKSSDSVLRDVREAQAIAAKIKGVKFAAAPKVTITEIKGFSPQSLRTAIDKIVAIRQRVQQIMVQYKAVLSKLKNLEDDEKKGLVTLKKAAAQMKQKARYLVEAENGLLEFTAFLQDKRPGVEQMLADPETSKFGDKAGDFFNRIGAKLGKDVQDAVGQIYSETAEDLTHTADAIRGLKIISKTASVKTASMKKAGLADMAVSVKEWLAGRTDTLAQRILNFTGDIKRWVKGFMARTAIVSKETNRLLGALDSAKASIDSALT